MFSLDLPAGRLQPVLWRFLLASVVAILASLAACAILGLFGVAAFPSTAGYEHYSFADYGKFTIAGVGLACVAWPAVTWLTSRARRLYLWLAIAVTIVGLAPDGWILLRGAPAPAVFVLVLMHLALALITYPAMVFIAPQPRVPREPRRVRA